MPYPLISEYKDAILSAEDNFNELSSLRPVLDSRGEPVMSSGNFAVVFKMTDVRDGKLYAVKCFIKEQPGRAESYRKIADELEVISSSYLLPLRYLENELFVDSDQCSDEEFPVVVMEWVEGETLDSYVNRNLGNPYELAMASYRFNRMAAWLLAQPFAHGDLKPDNILVRPDGSPVLVDYDGMFVPSMKGEKARETGSPDYRHPNRTDIDFNEHIDDFSIAAIALSLKAISLNPTLKSSSTPADTLLLTENDFRQPSESRMLSEIQKLTSDSDLSTLLGIFYIALAKNSLEALSFRLFITEKPKQQPNRKKTIPQEKIDTSCTDEDIANGIADEFGVIYSKDGNRLLKCNNDSLTSYQIKPGTQIICDKAFWFCSITNVTIPDSVTSIGYGTFSSCDSLISMTIPNSVTSIGKGAFYNCKSLENVTIPNSVTSIGDGAFSKCESLESVTIPNSVTSIGARAFYNCKSLEIVTIPNSVTSIGDNPFMNCPNLNLTLMDNSPFRIVNNLLINKSGTLIACLGNNTSVVIPNRVTSIGNYAFFNCESIESVTFPNSVTSIGELAFYNCESLESVTFPDSVTSIGESALYRCHSLKSVTIPKSLKTIGKHAFPEDCNVFRRD